MKLCRVFSFFLAWASLLTSAAAFGQTPPPDVLIHASFGAREHEWNGIFDPDRTVQQVDRSTSDYLPSWNSTLAAKIHTRRYGIGPPPPGNPEGCWINGNIDSSASFNNGSYSYSVNHVYSWYSYKGVNIHGWDSSSQADFYVRGSRGTAYTFDTSGSGSEQLTLYPASFGYSFVGSGSGISGFTIPLAGGTASRTGTTGNEITVNGVVYSYACSMAISGSNGFGFSDYDYRPWHTSSATAKARVTVRRLAPKIEVDRQIVDFGSWKVKDVSEFGTVQRLVIRNTGPTATTLNVGVGSVNAPFSIELGGGTFSLAGGARKEVYFRFKPSSYGVFEQTLNITHNDSSRPNPLSVTLKATAKTQLKVWFNAFIPKDIPWLSYPAPANFPFQTVIPILNIIPQYETGVLTDSRSFSNNPAEKAYRSHHEIILETDGKNVTEISQSHSAGNTTVVNRAGDVVFDGQGKVNAQFSDSHTQNGVYSMHFRGWAETGLTAWLYISGVVPSIDYEGDFVIDLNTRQASFDGETDSFPAYESYIAEEDGQGNEICKKGPQQGSDPLTGLLWSPGSLLFSPYSFRGTGHF